MLRPTSQIVPAAQAVITAVQGLLRHCSGPILVALDGPSGAGKSTLASFVAEALDATVVPTDDFFAADIPTAEWKSRSPKDRAADAIDRRRLRSEALEPLLAGRTAKWHAFDFDAGTRPDGTYPMRSASIERQPAQVGILHGAYTTRPELADLVTLSVLVDAPESVRHARLAAREEPGFLADWHALWDDAEVYYFTRVRPPGSFDLVISMAGG